MIIKKNIVLTWSYKWQILVIPIVVISLFGCSTIRPDRLYLHNPAKKELIEKAKSNWTPVQEDLWQKLLNNQKLTSGAYIDAQEKLQQAVISTNHSVIVKSTWSELLVKAEEYKNKLTDEKKQLDSDRKEVLEDKTEIGKAIKKLIEENSSKEAAIKKAQNDQLRWHAELVLFEKATQGFLVQQAIEQRNIENVKAKTTKEIFTEILDEKITFVNSEGKNEEKKIRDLLPQSQLDLINNIIADKENFSGWQAFIKQNGKQLDGIAEIAPPGITLQIISLGADLAKAQLDRAEAIKKRLDEEMVLFSRREKEIDESIYWMDQAITRLGSTGFKHQLNKTVLDSIEHSIRKKPSNTYPLILKLQTFVLAEDLFTISNKDSFEIAKESLRHYYKIKDSAISAREHEVLIQRGLETLVTYHSGGITQEEINSILQATQAVALGVISGGILR